MKTALLLAVSLASASMAVQADRHERKEYGYMYDGLVKICINTQKDNALGLFRTLKDYRVSRQDAVNGVVCNGQQLMDFARANQAVKITRALQRYEDPNKGRTIIRDITAPAAN
ncbi:DUF3718 domain-containing protein [Rheinheimera muenzenbergensis]|uniref:DUF3718 domain-containing protein n=1 Tax=Rheinheimera muenzenbergensis TaxID=1193628 RepID=A0ABU8C3S2_9GAMM